jgi:hypothetical protein
MMTFPVNMTGALAHPNCAQDIISDLDLLSLAKRNCADRYAYLEAGARECPGVKLPSLRCILLHPLFCLS